MIGLAEFEVDNEVSSNTTRLTISQGCSVLLLPTYVDLLHGWARNING